MKGKSQITNHWWKYESPSQIANRLAARVAADGGVLEDREGLESRIQFLVSKGLWNEGNAIWIPHAYSEDKLYAAKGGPDADLTYTCDTTRTRKGPKRLENVPYNLVSNSNTFTGITNGTTPGYGVSPLGFSSTLITTGPSNEGCKLIGNGISVNGGDTYTFSWYIRSVSGTGAFTFRIDTDLTVGWQSEIITVGTEWTRIERTIVAQAGATSFTSNTRLRGANSAVNQFEIACSQVVIGTEARDYIDTTDRFSVPALDYLTYKNELLYSEEFNQSTWSKGNTTVTSNQANAPDNTLTGDLITEIAGSGTHNIFRSTGITVSANEIVTFSIYLKAGTRRYLVISSGSSTNNFGVVVDTTSMTIVSASTTGIATLISYGIVDTGTGWHRVKITGHTTATNHFPGVGGNDTSSYTGGGSSSGSQTWYQWGAQWLKGENQPYVKSTSVSGIGRLSPVLSFEPTKTNLLLQSENLGVAPWSVSGVTISPDSILAPDGLTTADKVIPTAATTPHYHNQNLVVSDGANFTISFFAKAGGHNFVCIAGFGLAAADESPNFDLVNGTVTIPSTTTIFKTASIETVLDENDNPTGWFRCIASILSSTTDNFAIVIPPDGTTHGNPSWLGNGVDGVYVWGTQIEAGAYATSYIPTSSGSVQRNLNSANLTSIPGLAGASSITFIIEMYCSLGNNNASGDQFAILIASNRIQLLVGNTIVQFYCNDGTSLTGPTVPTNQWNKLGLTWDGTTWKVYMNGSKVKEVAGASTSAFASGSININHRLSGWLKLAYVGVTPLSEAMMKSATKM